MFHGLKWPPALVVLTLLLASCSEQVQQDDGWQQYKVHFIRSEGAVIDSVNGGISHSEGQGMAMLLATTRDDRDSFDRIWQWTRQHLQVRQKDRLLVWRWQRQQPHITDQNNATDGDILVAWALIRAYRQWSDNSYLEAARAMLADIRNLLLITVDDRLLLLPGQHGFIKDEGVIVNPSYWVFPALQAFAAIEPEEPVWPELIASGRNLIAATLTGVWKLPPDWLMVRQGAVTPAKQFPVQFGLDAVRIPLYLVWGGFSDHASVKSCRRFWSLFTGHGAWPDRASLNQTTVHFADRAPGVQAIAVLLNATGEDDQVSFPVMNWQQAEYYQATLLLIAGAAHRERAQ